MKRLALSALILLGLAACETLDFSDTAENAERSQCRAEADAYPGSLEDCEGIGEE